MTSPNGTTLVEAQEIIHELLSKTFDGGIKLNDVFMTSPKYVTLLEVKENIHDSLIWVL